MGVEGRKDWDVEVKPMGCLVIVVEACAIWLVVTLTYLLIRYLIRRYG